MADRQLLNQPLCPTQRVVDISDRLNLLRLRKKKAGAKAVKDKSFSPAEDLGGIAQSIGQGLIPFYDEIGSGIRSLVD